MKSEKAIISAKDYGSNKNLTNEQLTNEQLTMNNLIPKQNKFQYDCSFCLRELPSGGIRFAGIGACPLHFTLAERLINSLREYRANCFSNLGVRK